MSERWYLDTSAALKLVLDEGPTSEQLARSIDQAGSDLIGTRLLEVEMRRAAHRIPELHQDTVTAFLSTIEVHSLHDPVYRQAGRLEGSSLRSLDALHLASALALGADQMLTYDQRLARASGDAGMPVLSPTPDADEETAALS